MVLLYPLPFLILYHVNNFPFLLRSIYLLCLFFSSYFILLYIKQIKNSLPNSLGYWSPNNKFKSVDNFLPVELRDDFYGFPIVMGVRNVSVEEVRRKDNHIDEDEEDDNILEEIMDLIAESLNATYCTLLGLYLYLFVYLFRCSSRLQTVSYEEIGYRTKTGVWTELLGAVVEGEVDIALETIPVTSDKFDVMSFTHAILTSR